MRAVLLSLLCACGVVKTDAPVVTISPENPKTDDDLVATVDGTSTYTLQWSKNGSPRSDLVGEMVDHLLTTRGDVWHVDVTAGGIVASAEATIANTPPPVPSVHLTPDPPGTGSPAICMIDPPAADADGDAVSYSATWIKNGAPFTSTTNTTFAGDTIPASAIALDDSLQCTVTATDSFDVSIASSPVAAVQCVTGGTMSFAVNGVNETGTIQTWQIPAGVCQVTIEAGGARGGTGNAAGTNNTNGARMIGTFKVAGGSLLRILVGQAAQPNVANMGALVLAGGGGTFVVDANNDPLVIAGGGGSNFSGAITDDELEGRIVTSGGMGPGGTRADNGLGGTSLNTTSGAGGGLLTDGAPATSPVNPGGSAFVHGGAGSPGDSEYHAGFGGGGNRAGSFGEGGGGGYSGGSCSNGTSNWAGCGGGGSINKGTNQANTPGVVTGDGYVKITW